MAEISTPTYRIRHARESDVDQILGMICELAEYENSSSEVKATESSLRATLSFPSSSSPSEFSSGYAKTLLIFPGDTDIAPSSSTSSTEPVKEEKDGEAAGMALYFHNYSTWTAAPGIYLEDLYVKSAYRKRGFGKALLQALARECVRLECKRLDWSVLKWNQPSIDFYESDAVGAGMMSEWVGMRVDGERLSRLAERRD